MTKPYENTKTEKWIPKSGERVWHTLDRKEYEVMFADEKRFMVRSLGLSHTLSAPAHFFTPVDKPILPPAVALKICKKRREEHIKENSRLRGELNDQVKANAELTEEIERLQETESKLRDTVRTLTQKNEIFALDESYHQAENKRLLSRIQTLRADHAAAEDHYQQEIDKLNRIIGTFQNYVERLEDGIK